MNNQTCYRQVTDDLLVRLRFTLLSAFILAFTVLLPAGPVLADQIEIYGQGTVVSNDGLTGMMDAGVGTTFQYSIMLDPSTPDDGGSLAVFTGAVQSITIDGLTVKKPEIASANEMRYLRMGGGDYDLLEIDVTESNQNLNIYFYGQLNGGHFGSAPYTVDQLLGLVISDFQGGLPEINLSDDVNYAQGTPTTMNTRVVADGKIIVVNYTEPYDTPLSFEFTTDYGPDFFLGGDETNDSGDLHPGVYSVSVINLPDTWAVDDVDCSDGSDPGAIQLDPGETVYCTFYLKASDLYWTGSVDDNWFDTENWDPNYIPTFDNNAYIANGNTVMATVANAGDDHIKTRYLHVGRSGDGTLISNAVAIETYGYLKIGWGNELDPAGDYTGRVELTDADFTSNSKDVEVGYARAGYPGGGFPGGNIDGTLLITNGSMLNVDDMEIGFYRSDFDGSATGIISVTDGNIVSDSSDIDVGRLSGLGQSTATGTLTVTNGSISNVDDIYIARSSSDNPAGICEGSLTIIDGSITTATVDSRTNSLDVAISTEGEADAGGNANIDSGIFGFEVIRVGYIGDLDGVPSSTGNATGFLSISSGGLIAGIDYNYSTTFLWVGVEYTTNAKTANGTAEIAGNITGFSDICIGVNRGTGTAIGELNIKSSHVTGVDTLKVAVVEGTGTATGSIELNPSLISVADTTTLGSGSTLKFNLQGLNRDNGTDTPGQYSAIDTNLAVLDGAIEAIFDFVPPAGTHTLDLIIGGSAGAFGATDFASYQITDLPAGTTVDSFGLVQDDLGSGLVDIVRLIITVEESDPVDFQWITVGNTGNAPDPSIPGEPWDGSVAYKYKIAKHEVTNAQYAVFLNAVAAYDDNGLYNSSMGSYIIGGITRSGTQGSFVYSIKSNMGNKPVNFVSAMEAMRFANWLNNEQPTGYQDFGTTEDGVYTMNDGTTESRSAFAKFFLPTADEWYKAAYHQPSANGGDADNYWLYPTASNSTPTVAAASAVGDISNPGVNVANYNGDADWNGSTDGNVTSVGSAGSGSDSYYGTSDQGGNVMEWTERITGSVTYNIFGGSYTMPGTDMKSSDPFTGVPPGANAPILGIRIARPFKDSCLLGSYPNSHIYDEVRDVVVSGDIAYLAARTDGVLTIDVSDPTAPTLLNSYSTNHAQSITISGDVLYVADRSSGLIMFDLTVPAAPTWLGTYSTPGNANDVFIEGTLAYVADSSGGLQIINVTAPMTPSLVGSYSTPGMARGVTVSGSIAYVADSSSLQVIDVSAPGSPLLMGSYLISDTAGRVAVSGNTVYVTTLHNGSPFEIIDVTIPTAPASLGAFLGGTELFDVAIDGDVAYLADKNGLFAVDVSIPSAPVELGFSPAANGSPCGIDISNGLVYLAEFASEGHPGFGNMSIFKARCVQNLECDGDLDGDWDTDLEDFAMLSSNWLCTSNCPGDIDGDDDTDIADLATIAANWLCGTTP